jgi:hypothetical protein
VPRQPLVGLPTMLGATLPPTALKLLPVGPLLWSTSSMWTLDPQNSQPLATAAAQQGVQQMPAIPVRPRLHQCATSRCSCQEVASSFPSWCRVVGAVADGKMHRRLCVLGGRDKMLSCDKMLGWCKAHGAVHKDRHLQRSRSSTSYTKHTGKGCQHMHSFQLQPGGSAAIEGAYSHPRARLASGTSRRQPHMHADSSFQSRLLFPL